MAEDLGERTEEATPKRLRDARAEGQVARSQDLAAALFLAGVTAAVALAGTWMLTNGRSLIAEALAPDAGATQIGSLRAFTARIMGGGALIALPVVAAAWLAAVLAHVAQFGFLFAPKALAPDISKLSPLKGAKRIFGLSGVVKGGLDAVKVALVVTVASYTLYERAEVLIGLPRLGALSAVAVASNVMLELAWRLLLVLLLIGILDFSYQRWKRNRDLRMTKQQVRDELKQSEGDPEVKRRRQRLQQQLALQRLGAAVPTADVIVTNPEHVAVAIKYDEANMRAPRVVAKGAELLALRIRQIAAKSGIPIVERKPLARALFREVPVGGEIPGELYGAVAEVLAYVYRMEGRLAGAGRGE